MTRGRARRLHNIVIYAPLVLGLGLLVAGRAVPDLRGSFWVAVALLLVAFSCLVYAAKPGDGDLNDMQVAKLRHMGINYTPMWGRIANGVVGVALVAGSLWLLTV